MAKTKSCIHLQHALYFGPDEIRTCCQRFFYKGKIKGDAALIQVSDETEITYQQIINSKNELKRKINENEESQCLGCPQIKLKEWEEIESADVKTISVENHSLCNMKCTYCSPLYFGGVKPKYDILKAIDGADLSDNDLFVAWGGGEPTARRDFDDIFGQFNSHFSPKNQRVFTNALLYSPIIQGLLDKRKTAITTSLDAGTEETFRLVRKTRGLNKVVANLQKYASINPELVTVKYILTDENSSIEELNHFVDLIIEANLIDCHFLISTDFKNQELLDEVLYSGLYLYCQLFSKGINALNMDDHFFNRVNGTESLFSRLQELSKKFKSNGNWLERVSAIVTARRTSKIVVWGTGQQAEILINRIARRQNPTFQIYGIVDSNPDKWGEKFMGHSISAPEDIDDDCNIIIGSSNYYADIYGQVANHGIDPKRILPNIMF